MVRSLFLGFVANFLLLAALAAGDEDDYQCSGVYEYDASRKGNLSSPLYGKRPQYPINLYCQYELKAPDGHRIKVTFKDFDVDVSSRCTQDQLAIYGKNYHGLLGTFCGHELPRPILSKENEIVLIFRTDFMKGGRGYLLEYESGPNMPRSAVHPTILRKIYISAQNYANDYERLVAAVATWLQQSLEREK
ncbi:hypothetical protein AVEN_173552-1 [Araneus ventricosus]|uniref:CUB domain-containing protein n=1 Tax=Araneus ventricosus TaxID=182803 RepID=A0A4Y2WBN7_ARAVE|nr:hypothetical protein AVEN_60044-1 [Araneus ventricosus]GBO34885.1 hypothetical protein AVEN_173552-1 [Araneus ventricosus]